MGRCLFDARQSESQAIEVNYWCHLTQIMANKAPLSAADPHSYTNGDRVRTTHLYINLRCDFQRKILFGFVTLDVELVSDAQELLLDANALAIEKYVHYYYKQALTILSALIRNQSHVRQLQFGQNRLFDTSLIQYDTSYIILTTFILMTELRIKKLAMYCYGQFRIITLHSDIV